MAFGTVARVDTSQERWHTRVPFGHRGKMSNFEDLRVQLRARFPRLNEARLAGERELRVPAVAPDQFLYGRKGPWPQPSPSHPMGEAPEVLTIPSLEETLFNATIGTRYLTTQLGYPPYASRLATSKLGYTTPTDDEFNAMMFQTGYTRFLKDLTTLDCVQFEVGPTTDLKKYDFSAMDVVLPLEGTYCAGTKLLVADNEGWNGRVCLAIRVGDVLVHPNDSAWGLAKIYALQGAAYHMLFVVHPALHFPMDSLNAVMKTSVPYTHPLFQIMLPHTSYSLALNNAVLESANSVVNENPQGTWFDPLTGSAYNLKLLFSAGYTGSSEAKYSNAYPRYDFMNIPMGFDSAYGQWLAAYYDRAFLPFATTVAEHILKPPAADESTEHSDFLRGYTQLWARYCHTFIYGFPHEDDVLEVETLARTIALFLWDTSLAHGADHASFGNQIPVEAKFLRIRRKPPESKDDPPVEAGQIFTADDLARAELANVMFFAPATMEPNLNTTMYAFLDPELQVAQDKFQADLLAVSEDTSLTQYMPLTAIQAKAMAEKLGIVPPITDAQATAMTIPQSIQY